MVYNVYKLCSYKFHLELLNDGISKSTGGPAPGGPAPGKKHLSEYMQLASAAILHNSRHHI